MVTHYSTLANQSQHSFFCHRRRQRKGRRWIMLALLFPHHSRHPSPFPSGRRNIPLCGFFATFFPSLSPTSLPLSADSPSIARFPACLWHTSQRSACVHGRRRTGKKSFNWSSPFPTLVPRSSGGSPQSWRGKCLSPRLQQKCRCLCSFPGRYGKEWRETIILM